MKLLILDLEATCYEKGTEPPGFYSEVIEIGAIELDTETLEVGKEFDTFVKPSLKINTYLSNFCKKLTTITDKDLVGAPDLRTALANLAKTYNLNSMVFCSWGDYDRNKLIRDCEKFGIEYPFYNHISLKTAYADFYNVNKCGMDTALEQRKLRLTGTHHRGIDDVRNIANITKEMVKDGWKL
jgi:inhibitor of KinA sporulation pathway (predicted exonuclease)